ncbi:Mitogen-activated protein kinase kinase kinase 7 [Vanrija pseudolonga]|uniref:Mitogen-activated protein kinase kinase kinase 7 n=1 Tax=Vanrija pseudolonga TaxID=143232 RepID=A0AAF0Y1K1_9TREE|nr:Mitogen-activated protein kinase kinase kinase 7 [Vanrija pseudolonga]
MAKLKHLWYYGGDADEQALVIVDGVLYQIPYVVNSKGEEIMNEELPLPTLSPEPAGIHVEADGTARPLTSEEVAALKTKYFLDREGHEKQAAEIDAAYEREAAEAVATDVFQSLPVIADADETKYYLKAPRSGKEIRNLLKAQGLPHVVQLVGRTADKVVLVRAGSDFGRTFFRPDVEYPGPATHRLWAIDLADGLSALHAKDIFHRDITVFNALVDGDRATLCDLEAGPTSKAVIAPEVFTHGNEAFTDKSEVFALGALLWCFTQQSAPRPYRARYLERTGQFGSLIDRCLQVDPAKRPTAAELAQLLREEKAGEANGTKGV